MSPILQEIIGAGFGGAVTLLIVAIIHFQGRVGRAPKRLDRLDSLVPMMLDSIQMSLEVVILCLRKQMGHELNGEVEEALGRAVNSRDSLIRFLSKKSVSQKEDPR